VDILYLLVPLSVIAMLAVLGLFAWALQGGQLDNLGGEGERILWTDSQTHRERGKQGPTGPARRTPAPVEHPENRP